MISPASGIVFEIFNRTSTAEVTALTSFASSHQSIVLVAGYSDGSLLWHTLHSEEEEEEKQDHHHGGKNRKKENSLFAHLSGSILSETSSPWTVLDAFALHGGKHGVANLAGATADGQIAWGRIYVGSKKKPSSSKNKTISDTNELTWDSLLTASTSTISSIDTSIIDSQIPIHLPKEEGIIAVKAHTKAAEFITYRGEVIWSPFSITKRKQQKNPHVLRPPKSCAGWEKYRTEKRNVSVGAGDDDDAIIFSAVAMEAVSSPTSRIFSVVGDSSELASLKTGTAAGRPICHVIARVPLQKSTTSSTIESMVTLPGYVVAVTSNGQLRVYNTSGAFHRPSFSLVLEQPLHDLAAEIIEKSSHRSGRKTQGSSSAFWPTSLWKTKSALLSIKNHEYRIAAGVSTQFSTAGGAAAATTNGLVAIQFSPTRVGLYATSLPYTPPRGTPGGPGSPNRVNWLAALQPLLVAAVVGFAMHKAKSGKRQAAAQQFYRSRMMERAAAAAGGGSGSFGGARNGEEEDDWDAPFPWEKKVNSRSTSTLRGGGGGSSVVTGGGAGIGVEQNSRQYLRRFNLEPGLSGSRRDNKNTTARVGRGYSMAREGGGSGGGSDRFTMPPPVVDRAPIPGSNNTNEAVLGDIGSDSNSSHYSDGE